MTGAAAQNPASGAVVMLAPQPELMGTARVRDLESIETELRRIWSTTQLTTTVDGVEERRVAARSSVMNLVVVATRAETTERCAHVISRLTGRQPSRSLIVAPQDPDGPSWVDAELQAHCILPRNGAAEMCSERVLVRAGGETGQHLAAIVSPLLIHDLPVAVWWPGDVPFASRTLSGLLGLTDRLIVDGASWSGDGLARLRRLGELVGRPDLAISDFALVRQSRWREAIASTFDSPDVQPFLRSLRRIEVTYAARSDGAGKPGLSNVVKPLYHVGWLAARLGLRVIEPLGPGRDETRGLHGAWAGVLGQGRSRVAVIIRPETETAAAPSGTTLSVTLDAARRERDLRVVVTAQASTVTVEARLSGRPTRHRVFQAQRRTEVDMLGEIIESIGPDRLAADTTRAAVALLDGGVPGGHR